MDMDIVCNKHPSSEVGVFNFQPEQVLGDDRSELVRLFVGSANPDIHKVPAERCSCAEGEACYIARFLAAGHPIDEEEDDLRIIDEEAFASWLSTFLGWEIWRDEWGVSGLLTAPARPAPPGGLSG